MPSKILLLAFFLLFFLASVFQRDSFNTLSFSTFGFDRSLYILFLFAGPILLINRGSLVLKAQFKILLLWKLCFIILCPLVYFYGVFLGFFSGHNIIDAILTYWQILLLPSCLLIGSYFASRFSIIFFVRCALPALVLSFVFLLPNFILFFISLSDLYDVTATRVSYLPHLFLFFPLASILLYFSLCPYSQYYTFKVNFPRTIQLLISRPVLFVFSFLILALTTLYSGSKAFLFCSLLLIFLHLLVWPVQFLSSRSRFTSSQIFPFLLWLIGFFIIVYFILSSFLLPSLQQLLDLVFGSNSFSLSDVSVIVPDVREESQYHTIKQLNLFGNGSGSYLPVIRSFSKPYLGEFVYLNLIHKFGIFSFPIFYLFFLPLCFSLSLVFGSGFSKNYPVAFILLGSSLPFLTGFYTPIIFSPFFLFLLVFIVFLIDRLYLYNDLTLSFS